MIAPSSQITLPPRRQQTEAAVAVASHMSTITALNPEKALRQAHQLWTAMLANNNYPTDEDTIALIANFQFPHIRDQLIPDIPGIEEPPQHILFALTESGPKWSRVEWAHQLLLHAYTRTSPQHAAAILTTIGHINWREGRGSKAHRYLKLALDNRPRLPLRQTDPSQAGTPQRHRVQNPPKHAPAKLMWASGTQLLCQKSLCEAC
ncbi:hypothetical protein AB4Y81_19180 [Paenarthrobacter sp. TAF1]|uniref:hypothetical protein n=1 Tax=Paenarthrobacter sp. TAF1 TaxID=3233067 RepID=UPI003F98D79B